MGFNFEFNQLSPIYSNAAASGNDVLRLTGATPFTSALTGSNTVTVNFTGATPLRGQIYLGGFYTDSGSYLLSVQNAHFTYSGLGSGEDVVVGMTPASASFGGGPAVNGYITEFTITPEPGRVLLLAMGMAGMLLRRRRRAETRTS